MSKPTYIKKAIPDNTLASQNHLINQMISLGWTQMQMVISHHKGRTPDDFLLFHRQILNPVFSPNGILGKNQVLTGSQNTAQIQAQTGLFPLGAKSPMGVTHMNFAPAHAGRNSVVTNFSQILSIQKMRSADDSFVIGFDTEFYYLNDQRYILSWQFAFVDPKTPDHIEELIVFASGGSTLAFSRILAFIAERWQIGLNFGWSSADGVPYYSTRCWEVPCLNRNGDMMAKRFFDFNEALNACDDPQYKVALQQMGPKTKCRFTYVDGPNGVSERITNSAVNGFALGYINDYVVANKFAIPVTLVCHSGTADLSTLNVDDTYEKDVLKKLSSVQGGLVTLKEFYTHNPQLLKYWNLYPFRISVRDTMCFAPGNSKSLEALGNTIGVPKLEVQPPYSKDDMLKFMQGDLASFCEYAINDSVITLVYAGELWGYNKEMPVTITSASTRVAVPVIKDAFGLSETDEAGFDFEFRGLHKVKKGLSAFKGSKSGYIENTSLEPVSDDARILQEYARNAYKGGFNGCLRPGYYEEDTFDYDLENAYPTCMALVPDVDWSNPIAFEEVNRPLTRTMVRTPFEPVFAYVNFKFPESVKVPCIPVSVEGSLIYTRTNGDLDGVYASAPELWLALQLGAEVHVKRIYVGTIKLDDMNNPSRSLFHVVKQLIEDRSIAKASFGKGHLMELLIKLATNGLYGKTAQDVIDKHTWSALTEDMENIGGSRITSPVHACLTTAGVRAVLVAALNQINDLGYRVYSVTTDGFISDVPEQTLNGLDLYGLARYFRASRQSLTGSDDMWSMKHMNPHLLNLTTRGNVSLEVGNKALGILPGVAAHNSYVTGFEPDSYEDRSFFMFESMTRQGKLKTRGLSFEKFKNLSKKVDRTDFSVRTLDRELSMDFDLKRKPVPETMVDSYRYFEEQDDIGFVASFDTVPYETPAEFLYYKGIGRSCAVLRTCEDWSLFFDKIEAKKDGVRRNILDLEWSKLVSCIMSYRLGVPLAGFGNRPVSIPYLDDPDHSVAEKVAWINTFNASQKKKFTENTWKDCRKQTRASQILSEPLFIDKLKDMVSWTP